MHRHAAQALAEHHVIRALTRLETFSSRATGQGAVETQHYESATDLAELTTARVTGPLTECLMATRLHMPMSTIADHFQTMTGLGAQVRYVLDHGRVHAMGLASMPLLTTDQAEILLGHVPATVYVFNRQLAVISRPSGDESSLGVNLTTHRDVVRAAYAYFEATVESALPVQPAVADELTPRQHDIAQLLASGHADADIMVLLGFKTRTLRDEINKLKVALGANGRVDAVVRYLDLIKGNPVV